MQTDKLSDAELVAGCVRGDRDAFRRIVERYQTLVCSLAYSAIGNVSHSEDLAQETFLTAWKQINKLDEPEKLRAWLCGITRFLIGKHLRRQSREPLRTAEPLDAANESPAPGPLPSDQAIAAEESAIIWRALEGIPETYREPLVLFYRENQSVERVAAALDLTQDAAKQRLSRGRKLLQEEVLALVEGALAKTAPGKTFTMGVVAALPLIASPAQAAVAGAITAKTGTVVKAAGGFSAIFLLGPAAGILGGILGTRASFAGVESPRERKFLLRYSWAVWSGAAVFTLTLLGAALISRPYWKTHPVLLAFGLGSLLLLQTALSIGLAFWSRRALKRIRQEEASKRAGGSIDSAAMFCGLICAPLAIGCIDASAAQSSVEVRDLGNRISVVSVYFPASTNVSIFTLLPPGLVSDEPNQAQWSHLVEHLVIRSIVPPESSDMNAETLADHMRLEFFGHTGNWREGFARHRQIIEGVRFDEKTLATEKPKILAECDFTARNLTTHKFALAAWGLGVRHGSRHVPVKADVTAARLAEVQRFGDEHLGVGDRITMCVAGGVEAAKVFAEAEHQLKSLPPGRTAAPAQRDSARILDLTWDLDARHLLITWPIPGGDSIDHAALMTAAQCLNLRLFSDLELKRSCGAMLAGADLVTPEGHFFFISASVRSDAKLHEIGTNLLRVVTSLSTNFESPALVVAAYLGESLTTVPDPLTLRSHVPGGVPLATIEGNLALQFATHEHRYGPRRLTLAKQLAAVSLEQMHEAVRRHLSPSKARICAIRPLTSQAEPHSN